MRLLSEVVGVHGVQKFDLWCEERVAEFKRLMFTLRSEALAPAKKFQKVFPTVCVHKSCKLIGLQGD